MPFREGSSQSQVGLLSTPTVSSVPGEHNYFSAVANVIITAGASGYCSKYSFVQNVSIYPDLDKIISY